MDGDTPSTLDREKQTQLLRVAVQSVRHGLSADQPLQVDLDSLPPRLVHPQACFVTLHHGDELRGCVGTLEPHHPLAQQVANSAYDAAFRDLRLSPIDASEIARLNVHISILSALTDLDVAGEDELLALLRPGIDGVVLSEGELQATFLPQVWKTFALPSDFVGHLKRKAGLGPGHWSPTLRWRRYTVESFGALVADLMDA
jgi:AmmeMemoRadiSam system protein A